MHFPLADISPFFLMTPYIGPQIGQSPFIYPILFPISSMVIKTVPDLIFQYTPANLSVHRSFLAVAVSVSIIDYLSELTLCGAIVELESKVRGTQESVRSHSFADERGEIRISLLAIEIRRKAAPTT